MKGGRFACQRTEKRTKNTNAAPQSGTAFGGLIPDYEYGCCAGPGLVSSKRGTIPSCCIMER